MWQNEKILINMFQKTTNIVSNDVVQRIFSALFCVIWSFSELLLLFSVTLSTNTDDFEENVCINQMEFSEMTLNKKTRF